jgi:murein DD-endopeptidase MepM/ murein hydrolase activator NlpD
MKALPRLRSRLALAAACLLGAALPAVALPGLELPELCRQGDALVVRLRSALPLDQAVLSLRMPDGKQVVPAQAVLRKLESGEFVALAILPLPMGAPTGQASVLFACVENGIPLALGTTFELRKRDYAKMDIKLNEALTAIKAEPDPKKDEESRVLTDILCSSDTKADYLDGPFIRPIHEKAISAAYGDDRRYIYEKGGSSRSVHTGLDLYDEAGTPIQACDRGRVVFAKLRILTGNTVVIEHGNGLFSLYYHMESIGVKTGDIVETGQIIGKVGATGLATGPHLHWELRLRAEALDPESLIGHPLLDKTIGLARINGSYEGR